MLHTNLVLALSPWHQASHWHHCTFIVPANLLLFHWLGPLLCLALRIKKNNVLSFWCTLHTDKVRQWAVGPVCIMTTCANHLKPIFWENFQDSSRILEVSRVPPSFMDMDMRSILYDILLILLTSISYPFTPIKRALISLGRGSPSFILDSPMHTWGLSFDCRTFSHCDPIIDLGTSFPCMLEGALLDRLWNKGNTQTRSKHETKTRL